MQQTREQVLTFTSLLAATKHFTGQNKLYRYTFDPCTRPIALFNSNLDFIGFQTNDENLLYRLTDCAKVISFSSTG